MINGLISSHQASTWVVCTQCKGIALQAGPGRQNLLYGTGAGLIRASHRRLFLKSRSSSTCNHGIFPRLANPRVPRTDGEPRLIPSPPTTPQVPNNSVGPSLLGCSEATQARDCRCCLPLTPFGNPIQTQRGAASRQMQVCKLSRLKLIAAIGYSQTKQEVDHMAIMHATPHHKRDH